MVDKSEKFNWLVRVGYFARAILYAMLGVVALSSASEISQGTDGIFRAIENFPAGFAILWIMAIGLLGYSLFRFASTLFDIENHGSDGTGWATRIGHAGSGVAHAVLAYAAFQFASGGGSSGDGAQVAAESVLNMTFGGAILGVFGIIFFITAAFQLKKSLTAEFMNRIGAGAPSYTKMLGRLGYAARAVVYVLIGWSLVRAGFGSGDTGEVRTLGDALAGLAGSGVLFTLTAIGLLLFGIFSLVLSRYRIIPDLSQSGVPRYRS